MISNELLSILCCPETRQDLVPAEKPLIEKLNQLIAKRELKNRTGDIVGQKLDGGLIRNDRKFLYPVRNDIPVMLLDEAISLQDL